MTRDEDPERQHNKGGNYHAKNQNNRAAAKRFKVTGTGKLKRNKAYKSHILTKKSTKRKRNLRQAQLQMQQCKEHEEGFTISVRFES